MPPHCGLPGHQPEPPLAPVPVRGRRVDLGRGDVVLFIWNLIVMGPDIADAVDATALYLPRIDSRVDN